ncbi:uncharacterized protein YecE (DUF72 family) [Dyadobacter sp. BE34]|uniref:Uncharacterized protein YecE (DUF72 family) n=1 Tax=Dyadobacter fermentans TaxID=94254 RepID=A0ABU1R9F4_9BACT|nr:MULTISPECIES: DUF72 domain-containing protein [Dyadobacter]MDR6809529.1 uncharacterized protein YecE (DUF72 family) [Dyadobacter fermentans]MDR7047214.1 uncharacterized protein YecE (DUF72 family) [Dyadobacter sp. BE242]MDR7201450.1 uncharacterized protein YecE (DUF72 family) [Dyadobacter sp. BE34]MDR7219320.1 uncharacterized protein YecE (DUF72 family) [Dyadobacter sp. BE31]MDR7267086.1 uncharacterized protein YecE (DUF72 family) [Dyadobacter sp. BE32]
MKFGKVDDADSIDFTLPPDNPANKALLNAAKGGKPGIYIGCAKWNKTDLKGFYPKGTKDELAYYATQFNSIELNATFYNNFPVETIESWYAKTPAGFKFFPKLHQGISHWKRLKDAKEPTDIYLDGIAHLQDKLGMLFLQMPDNFGPKNWEILKAYLEEWPSGFPLALELRHTGWYDGSFNSEDLYSLLEKKNITHIVTDSAGRRDLLHMRLTTPTAFIRYNGANVDSDYTRLDDWFERLRLWTEEGIQNIYFFVHQNHEEASPLLSSYLIQKLNKELGMELQVPYDPRVASGQVSLFK